MSMARAAFPPGSDHVLKLLEGGKRRLSDGRVSFHASAHNLGIVGMLLPALAVETDAELSTVTAPDLGPPRAIASVQTGESRPLPPNAAVIPSAGEFEWCGYTPRLPPMPHQMQALARCADAKAFALFLEPGLGKSAVALHKAGRHHARGEIDALLVVTLNSVHRQWCEGEVPKHLGTPHYTLAYDKKPLPEAFYHSGAPLRVLCMSFDSLISKGGSVEVARFTKAYARRFMMVADESHAIKNHAALRAIACCKVGKLARYRLAMTGTPLAKALEDEWSQFRFLDENIIGVKYLSTFRAQYCIMGGYENRSVIGHKNLDGYNAKVAPYCFRLRKEDALDLPPKVYSRFAFDLAPEQRRHYDALKRNLLTQLDDGTIATAQNAAVLLTRLQQITSGLLVGEDGQAVRVENARIKALETLLETLEGAGKVLIWARFTHEIVDILEALDPKKTGVAVSLYGDTSADDRSKAVDRFLNDPECRYFVSNPAAGGTGINLQGGCNTVVYYSNSFNAIHRWQSEDRVHRIGTTGTVNYYDLVGRKTGDERILSNLQNKAELSKMAAGNELRLLREVVSDE